MRNMTRSLLVAAGLLSATDALATDYTVQFCFQYRVDFLDADPTLGDDYLTDNSDVTARGIWIHVVRSDSTEIWAGYADWTGASAGCTSDLTISDSYTYMVGYTSKNSVNSNLIEVYSPVGAAWGMTTVVQAGWFPTSGGRKNFKTSIDQRWMTAAAASHALYRSNFGLAEKTFVFHTDPDQAGGSGWDRQSEVIEIGDNGNRKYVTVHEFGHAIGHYLNGRVSPTHNYGATKDNCYTDSGQSHEMNQKEYQSSAAWEGWAHFYAAIAFNEATSDCKFYYYKGVNWDLLFGADNQKHDCEDAPMSGLSGHDYLGNMCSGTLTNRGTEFDWLRFWWDLRTDQGVTTTKIGSIWNDANPDTWRATDSGSADLPSTRLRNAASANGVLTEWDLEDDINGVHR